MKYKKILIFLFLVLFLVSISNVSAYDSHNTNLTEIETDNIGEIDTDIVEAVDNTDTVSESNLDDENGVYDEVFYFDASAPADGKGTKDNPFKYLTDSRLPYGVTAYFAEGVYEISSNCIVYSNAEDSQVKFIGANMEKTIIRYVGEPAIGLTVPDMARLYVNDLTFDHITIENRGTFDATNVIFKNNPGVDIHSAYPGYNNSFGGAIYSPGSLYYSAYGMKSYLNLNNCLFINNTAVYGGSVYHKNGNTIIRNTKFINSSSGLYGGVLATDGGDIIIENCVFENYHADGDAGGAIYAKTTNLAVKNSNFTNGYSDFGGAICNLNSVFTIENSNFINHTAKYEGGAIYVMYGSVDIKNANIKNSASRDGGALFVDNCTTVKIKDTNFDTSIATRIGGVIFSNANKLELDNVNLGSGVALIDNLIHDQSKYDYDIGYNSDYIMMVYNSSYSGVLPQRFDLRDYGYVTPIRDQQNGGNCWAFAGIAALESCILKATGISYDLSEENVKNLVELYSAYGWKYDTNEGGHSEMTWGNLISWLGPVLESDDKYDDYSTLSPLLDAIMHVQNVYYLPARQNALDNDAIKKAIMDYGGISVGIYWESSPLAWKEETSAYFHAIPVSYANHAVTIVGWDDNFNKDNFAMGDMAETNGAWIVKNSWGTDWGDNGFFYVSYYDPVVCKIGEANDVFTFILNDTVRYNRNYQYDIGGMTDFLYPNSNSVSYKNTFTSIGNDILSAFSTVFEHETDFEVKLYINDDLKLTQNGHSFAGYATIPFKTEFLLNAGDKFAIEIKITSSSEVGIPICEVVTASRLTYDEGISFINYDGSWKDLYTFVLDRPDIEHRYASQVACIKAFTRTTGVSLGSSVSIDEVTTNVGKTTSIKAIVKDENNNIIKTGYVIFDVNGKKEGVRVVDGVAVLNMEFMSEGIFDVKATYDGGNSYKNSTSTSKVTVDKSQIVAKDTQIDIANVEYVYGNVGSVTATLKDSEGNAVSFASLKLIIDGKTITSTTNGNGVATFNIASLSVGTFKGTCVFDETSDYKSSQKEVTVKIIAKEDVVVKNTEIKVSNVEYEIGSDNTITATLLDSDGKAVSGVNVKIIVGETSLSQITDSNGIVRFNLNLNAGKYNALFEFAGNDLYNKSQASSTINVLAKSQNQGNSSSQLSIKADNSKRAQNSGYAFQARFFDGNGNPLSNKTVQFIINGNDYFVKTDEFGIAKLDINLAVGKYNVTAVNPATGDEITKEMEIVSRITDNTDVKFDYSYSGVYKLRVYGDNGQVVGSGESVIVKINGKTYTLNTDNDGFVSLKITSLLPKTYTITAEYRGVAVSNKVVVKQILKAKNSKYKRYKVKKYTATLKTSAGKAIKGKKITFKIKGKTYTAKTNKKGVATIKIKQLTKVGKYKITINYLKTSISKTIQIRR